MANLTTEEIHASVVEEIEGNLRYRAARPHFDRFLARNPKLARRWADMQAREKRAKEGN